MSSMGARSASEGRQNSLACASGSPPTWTLRAFQHVPEGCLAPGAMPFLPPLLELTPLLGQTAAVQTKLALDARTQPFPIQGLSFLQVRLQGLQTLTGHMTVIGPAQNLLHVLHG